jgi:hypothetical protein
MIPQHLEIGAQAVKERRTMATVEEAQSLSEQSCAPKQIRNAYRGHATPNRTEYYGHLDRRQCQ